MNMNLIGQVAPVVIQEATKYISKRTTTPASELATFASDNDTSSIRRLLEKDPDINRGPGLIAAASAGNLAALDLLLEPPTQPKHSRHHHKPVKIDLDVWSSGTTPLLAAVRNKHVKTTKYLLEEGADSDLCPKSGITALQEASQAGDIDIVRVLLLYGANVNHPDHCGDTPLIVASRWGHAKTARCLLQNSARINECNDKGSTPLSVAARHDYEDVIEELLDPRWEGSGGKGTKINVNRRDKKGRTALHRAVEGIWLLDGVRSERKEEVVRILLQAGADPKVRDKDGKTPADRVGWLTGGEELRRLLSAGDMGKKPVKSNSSRPRPGTHSRSNTF
ncbi:related to Ca2+/calmodulin-dependent protein kinase Ibeta2 [Phialocephala subalpina]|uniref:Related to Ca2+/calmodulin-dependent protein kinase Ibeta2 n=1 Tax=Phialocephala subalpina TaxID=576137 RepID=A0A1L7X186_9HELO|nr:related to Ca2+/calmodulin-dependent protein kinase Ibeta2 [Phialocephala subalpina]